LIADEPTTALDVTIQAQIVELVTGLRDQLHMAVIWITHDLGVVAGIADRVIVMYAGFIVEEASVDELYEEPRHPIPWPCWLPCRASTAAAIAA
jgi:oligopeptide transport system ATP-binding protein